MPSGRDRIDHPPNRHDDVANCVGGVLTRLSLHQVGEIRTIPISEGG